MSPTSFPDLPKGPPGRANPTTAFRLSKAGSHRRRHSGSLESGEEATGFEGNGWIQGGCGEDERGPNVPHDGAEALAGDGVPALVVRDGVALVGGAAVRAAAAHRRWSSVVLRRGWCLSSVVCVCGGGQAETPSPSGSVEWLRSLICWAVGPYKLMLSSFLV